MIITQTPFRMSFAGGGSDFPAFYRRCQGAVVSATIDKFVYIAVNKKFDSAIRVSYSKTEEVDSVDQIEHRLVRECLRLLGISGGVEITSIADIPSRGSGLGSSGAFTVGLLQALHAFCQQYVSREHLGAEACKVEIDLCKDPIGKQDQYSAAFGGLNFIQFCPDDRVIVQPILCAKETMEQLQQSIVVFYTGMTRDARSVSEKQSHAVENDTSKREIVERMSALAYTLNSELQSNRLDSFGEILHENWMLKKKLAENVSNAQIDSWYERARNAGAKGGKLLGAGGGGFLMFYAPPERHETIAAALHDLQRMDFKLEPRGSRIILYQP